MVRFPEAEARLFKNKFVCRKCKSVITATTMRIMSGKISCRKCGSHQFKPKRKK
ncbi:MAG: 50S ribosomal protein L40e [Candidatus Woesearchaeota archaeon]